MIKERTVGILKWSLEMEISFAKNPTLPRYVCKVMTVQHLKEECDWARMFGAEGHHMASERQVRRAWCVRHLHHCSRCGFSLEMRILRYSPFCCRSRVGAPSEHRNFQHSQPSQNIHIFTTNAKSRNGSHNVQPNAVCAMDAAFSYQVAFPRRPANERQRSGDDADCRVAESCAT